MSFDSFFMHHFMLDSYFDGMIALLLGSQITEMNTISVQAQVSTQLE